MGNVCKHGTSKEGWLCLKCEKEKEASTVASNDLVMPAYGQKVSYVMEDGEKVKGKVIGVDNYENHMLVTVKREDGSLYGAKLKRRA